MTFFAWEETSARQLKRYKTARQPGHVWKKYCITGIQWFMEGISI